MKAIAEYWPIFAACAAHLVLMAKLTVDVSYIKRDLTKVETEQQQMKLHLVKGYVPESGD